MNWTGTQKLDGDMNIQFDPITIIKWKISLFLSKLDGNMSLCICSSSPVNGSTFDKPVSPGSCLSVEIVYTAIHEFEMVFASLERDLIIRQSLQC